MDAVLDLIKEFWPVLVFLGISYVSYKRSSAEANRRAKEVGKQQPEVFTEEFPQVEFSEPQPTEQQFNPFFQPVRTERSRPKNVAGNRKQRPADAEPQPVVAEEKKRERKFAFKDKSDAKRAIIYSEILNRKY